MINALDIKALGAEIRRLRKAAGLRQDQLAGVAGVGLRFLVELEGGKDTSQIGKVFRVLRVLGCEVLVGKRGGGEA